MEEREKSGGGLGLKFASRSKDISEAAGKSVLDVLKRITRVRSIHSFDRVTGKDTSFRLNRIRRLLILIFGGFEMVMR